MSEETTQNFPGDGLRGIHARLDSIDGRLAALEDKVDRRMQETRPIWEQVLAKLDGLETELRRGFRRFDRHTSVLAGDVIAVRAAQHDLDKRVEKLEVESSQP